MIAQHFTISSVFQIRKFSLQLNCKVTFSFGQNVLIVKINPVTVTLRCYINFCQLLPKKTAKVFNDKSFYWPVFAETRLSF